MKVLLTGAAGQLGTALRQSVAEGVDIVATDEQDLDICDPAGVASAISDERPELLINAAAYTQVDRAESDREIAFEVNAAGPRLLAEALAAVGGRMIHVSTDFVFAGDRPVPYAPDDPTSPLSVYGETKRAGEAAVLARLGVRAAVVRTSWLYSTTGRNFVRTMLTLMASRDSLGVVYDQVGSPTSAASLARAIWAVAERAHVHGLQHWADRGVASWYDFAVAIQEEAIVRGLLAKAIPIRAIRSADYPTPARRPSFSVLDTRRTAAELGFDPPHWRQSLRNMLDELVKS